MLKEARGLGVKGLVTCIHRTDIETVDDTSGECVQPSRAVNLESKRRRKSANLKSHLGLQSTPSSLLLALHPFIHLL